MKKVLPLAILFLTFSYFSFAGRYMDLVPGKSSKADADGKLGGPIREVIKDRRYDYSPEGHDASRISLTFKEGGIIESINIYVKEEYEKYQFQELFNLERPSRTEIDSDGDLVEYYIDEGISLHYCGPNTIEPVRFFSHFDPALFEAKTEAEAQEFAGVIKYRQAKKGTKPHLGALVTGHEGAGVKILRVQEDSPAGRAGLKAEDVILGLENYKFDANRINPRDFAAVLSMMPVEKPLPFLVLRGQRIFEVHITLEEITQ